MHANKITAKHNTVKTTRTFHHKAKQYVTMKCLVVVLKFIKVTDVYYRHIYTTVRLT